MFQQISWTSFRADEVRIHRKAHRIPFLLLLQKLHIGTRKQGVVGEKAFFRLSNHVWRNCLILCKCMRVSHPPNPTINIINAKLHSNQPTIQPLPNHSTTLALPARRR